MNQDKNIYSSFTPKKRGFILYGDNNKRMIIGYGMAGKHLNPTIEDVLLFEGLKCNLLSIRKLYDKGNKVIFDLFVGRIIKEQPIFI